MSNEPRLGDALRTYLRECPSRGMLTHFRRRENLYMCGERDDHIYLIADGHVKAMTTTHTGKECLLGVYSAPDILGESCLLSATRQETATAMDDVFAHKIPRAWFLEALSDGSLFEGYLQYLTRRITEQQETMTFLVTSDSEQRLAATLLRLSRRTGAASSGWVLLDQRITHEELAAMVGTTRSRIGFFLKRLRENALVGATSDNRLAVHRERLSRFVGLPVAV